MAERRMFTKRITDSDAFIEMPSTTQALYLHLNQAADDDGFNNQIQLAMMKAHASVDDLKLLMMKNFIIRFENGVIVIKHWRMHNTLRKDRYTPTNFQEELAQLSIKENLSYSLSDGCQLVANGLPQDRIGKDRLVEDSINSTISNDIVCQTETVRLDVKSILDAWNSLSDYGIKPVSKISKSSKRYQSLCARIKEHGVENVLKAIENIKHSDFLQGKSKDWIITFDWFVKPNNFPKVLEGNYDNRDSGNNKYMRY